MKNTYSQVVVRFTKEVEKKIKHNAKRVGLSKAAWLRQIVLRELEKNAQR